ncbi:hypothetical protein WISP_143493 [Willisornis vidua]|uniref:Uncharacterized protein n=1 Tax=Willisornis vidua TaxID=1566151 RepID=A0ABQ9CLH6_9PASS|nr:hypothetical protein WISP_143493 [Willisornis vidua]
MILKLGEALIKWCSEPSLSKNCAGKVEGTWHHSTGKKKENEEEKEKEEEGKEEEEKQEEEKEELVAEAE